MEKQNELYMMNRPHGRMILASVEKGPLVWPSITEDGVTRLKEYVELTPAEAIQADCDIKYRTHSQGYQQKSRLLNIINPNKNVRLMHERNPDPLALVASHHLTQPAYQSHLHTHPQSLSQHHVSPYQSSQFVTPYQHQQFSTNQSTPLSITYPTNKYQSTVHHNVYSQQPSIPQLEYAPTTYPQQQPEFSQPDSSLVVPVFQKGDDPIDAINHMMSFLTAVVTSRYPTTNNQLRTSSNPRQQATIYDGKVTGHIAKQCTKPKRKRDDTWFNDKVLLVQAQASGQALTEDEIAFLADPGLPDI
ncbi:hypothetical protein Tco_0967684 [Tanacetum coccineum]